MFALCYRPRVVTTVNVSDNGNVIKFSNRNSVTDSGRQSKLVCESGMISTVYETL